MDVPYDREETLCDEDNKVNMTPRGGRQSGLTIRFGLRGGQF